MYCTFLISHLSILLLYPLFPLPAHRTRLIQNSHNRYHTDHTHPLPLFSLFLSFPTYHMESDALDTVLLAATLTVLALTGFMLFITLGAILPFSFVFVSVCSFFLSVLPASLSSLAPRSCSLISRDSRRELQKPARRKEDLLKIQQQQQKPATQQIVSGCNTLSIKPKERKDVERKTEYGVTL